MDVSLAKESYIQDRIEETDKCLSSEIIDTGDKSNFLESFLPSVSDVNETSEKGSEFDSPVIPCLDTIIGSVVGEIVLHKFDSINNLTVATNLIESPSVDTSKDGPECSSGNCVVSDVEKNDTDEGSVREIEKNSSNLERKECEIDVFKRVDSSSVALLETDRSDNLRDADEENHEVNCNNKKVESGKLDDECNEERFSSEINNNEQENKSADFQKNEITENFINLPSEQFRNEMNNIEIAQAVCDSLIQSSDCGMQLSTENQSDQTNICVIVPSKGSVNSLKIGKKLLESNSNEISSTNLSNTVENIVFGVEEQVLELDKNETKVKENSRSVHFSDLNQNQILHSDVEKNRTLNTDCEEKSQIKLNKNLIAKNIQCASEEEIIASSENALNAEFMEKQNSEFENGPKHLDLERDNHLKDEEIPENSSISTQLVGSSFLNDDSNKIFENEQENKTLSSDNIIKESDEKLLNKQKSCEKINSSDRELENSNDIFENEQEDKTLSFDNIIKELDEKLLNEQKSCEKKNSSNKELEVEGDLPCLSESNGSMESESLNFIDKDSSKCKVGNLYNELDQKTRNILLMIKPCKVMLERLSSETLKIYSYDIHPYCSDKGEMLMSDCLSSSSKDQDNEKIILKKTRKESSFQNVKEKSHQKLNSSLNSDKVSFKSPKIVPSNISKRKESATELNNNISSFMDSSLKKKQKKDLKGILERDSTHLKKKQVKRSRELDEVTVMKKNKKSMNKSSQSDFESNDFYKNLEKKHKIDKYDKKEMNDLKKLYSLKECKIVLENLDCQILEKYISDLNVNQILQVPPSIQYVDSDVDVCNDVEVMHIDINEDGTFKSQKHLLKKCGTKKTKVSAKLKKKLIIKKNLLLDAKSKRNTGLPLLKTNSSKPDIANYNSGEIEAAEETGSFSGDAQDNSDLYSFPQVIAIDDNQVETNSLIKEQIPIKRCFVKLEQCDSASLKKYLGKDWSKNLPQRVNLSDFKGSHESNSSHSYFSGSEYGDISESSDQTDFSSDSDYGHSFELELPDRKDHKDLFCKPCDKKFKTYSSLLSHEKKTHETFPFKCVLCKQCFKSRGGYMYHMKRDHPEVEPYVCDYPKCENSFRTKKQLSDHKKSHLRYCCRFCKRRYAKKIFLQQHVSDCH